MAKDKKSRTEYYKSYVKKNYDRVQLTLPKGKLEELKTVLKGTSVNSVLNAYINRIISAGGLDDVRLAKSTDLVNAEQITTQSLNITLQFRFLEL
jgi:hypothetical protein